VDYCKKRQEPMLLLALKDMENNKKFNGGSILDQIIMNHKAEEVASLDAVDIINNLFNELTERERDVLVRRHGLHGKGKETLENIGNIHSLTRERIRQIETSSIKKLHQLERLEEYISSLKKVILQLLEEHGGMMEREYLLDVLVNFSVGEIKVKIEDEILHKNYLDFMISKLLHNDFELISNSKHFKHTYKLKFQSLDHFETVLEELHKKLKDIKQVNQTDKIIGLVKELDAYQAHKEKYQTINNVDIAGVLNNELFEEDKEVVNNNKALYSLLKAAKKIEQNKYGHWGAHDWREIKPKTINDKIYLVLKNHGEALHFEEIADRINQVVFDNKKANAATVHNELILDNKYVLIGRGLYGLKEWGYKEGTVADVIEEILSSKEEPLNRDEIIEKVLEKRIVKRATVVLALMNKDKFEKVEGGYKLIV
jgi:hypothetical protein